MAHRQTFRAALTVFTLAAQAGDASLSSSLKNPIDPKLEWGSCPDFMPMD